MMPGPLPQAFNESEDAILTALDNAENGETYKNLSTKVKLSSRTLSKSLRHLRNFGIIRKDLETKKYHICRIFRYEDEHDRLMTARVAAANDIIPWICQLKHKENREKVLESYLIYNLAKMNVWLLKEIKFICMQEQFLPRERDHKKAEKFYHELTVSVENYLMPWISRLATAVGYNFEFKVGNHASEKAAAVFTEIAQANIHLGGLFRGKTSMEKNKNKTFLQKTQL